MPLSKAKPREILGSSQMGVLHSFRIPLPGKNYRVGLKPRGFDHPPCQREREREESPSPSTSIENILHAFQPN